MHSYCFLCYDDVVVVVIVGVTTATPQTQIQPNDSPPATMIWTDNERVPPPLLTWSCQTQTRCNSDECKKLEHCTESPHLELRRRGRASEWSPYGPTPDHCSNDSAHTVTGIVRTHSPDATTIPEDNQRATFGRAQAQKCSRRNCIDGCPASTNQQLYTVRAESDWQ